MDETTPGAGAYGTELETIRAQLGALVTAAGGPLRRISVRVGGAAVELEWAGATGTDLPRTEPPPRVTAAASAAPVPGGAAGAEAAAAGAGGGAGGDEAAGAHVIRASMVGTFYQAPEPGAAPFVRPGDRVEKGDQVGILEAMKLMTPVEADAGGRVVAMLAEDGTAVEYDQPLVSLDTEPAE